MTTLEPEDLIRTLRQDCPGVDEAWRAYVAATGGNARGLYNDAAVIARYLVESYERGETSEFAAVFTTLEAALRDRTYAGLLKHG